MRIIVKFILLLCSLLAGSVFASSQSGSGHTTDPQSTSGSAGSSGAAGSSSSSGSAGQTGGAGAGGGTGGTGAAGMGAGATGGAGPGGTAGATSHNGMGAAGTSSGAATQTGTAAPLTQAGASPAALNRADQSMLKNMAQAQMDEIAAARVALERSKNDNVRKYAQTMITDHTKALDSITTLARSKNVTLPTEPDTTHKAAAAAMSKLSGDAFDKAYMKQAGLSDHTKVLGMLQKGAKTAKDPDLLALVSTLTPTVSAHLKAAKSMQAGAGQ